MKLTSGKGRLRALEIFANLLTVQGHLLVNYFEKDISVNKNGKHQMNN
jgi:hypothetical protein